MNYTLQISLNYCTHKVFSAFVFRFLVTVANSGATLASVLSAQNKSSRHRIPYNIIYYDYFTVLRANTY
jgi:hypothetical protein